MDKGLNLTVIVPVYGAPALLERCLRSILGQDEPYPFDVVIADDGSPTTECADYAHRWASRRPFRQGATMVRRHEDNRGALANIVGAIRATPMEPDDVILICDGDDALEPHAVRKVKEIFGGTNLFAYGSYLSDPHDPACHPAEPIPEWVLRAGCFRLLCAHNTIPVNHAMMFRRCLFDQLDDDDFKMPDGEWMRYGYDLTLAAPMIELAGTRVEFNPDPIYIYTSDRPESVGRIHRQATQAEGRWVMDQPRKYEPMLWEPS